MKYIPSASSNNAMGNPSMSNRAGQPHVPWYMVPPDEADEQPLVPDGSSQVAVVR